MTIHKKLVIDDSGKPLEVIIPWNEYEEIAEMLGLEVTRELERISSRVKILVLSAHDDESYVAELLAAGVAGFLTKEEADQVIVEAIQAVAMGQDGRLSRRIGARVLRMERTRAADGLGGKLIS